MIRRNGMTVPLPGHLHDHKEKYAQLADWGYSDIWSAETDGADAFTPLALAAAWEPRLRLGTAIVPAYTRTAPVIAQSVAALADAAPGRFAIGIGSSSNVIVERWNGVPFVDPYKKVRDVVRFMHDAFSGEKITKEYDTFRVDGFRLSIKPVQKPTILIAALREGMLKLGAREADFVCPSEDTEVVRAGARFAIAAYMNVPVYADFHRWMGRAPLMQGMWDAWKAGDRKAALAAIPDQVVDELVVHGSPAHCRDIISEYFKNGVTTSSLAILPLDPNLDYWKSVEALSPSAS